MYTKEKWRYSEEYQEVTTSKIGIIEGSKSICAVCTFSKVTEEIQANGRLISASPELLEACTLMLQAFKDAPSEWLMTNDVAQAESVMIDDVNKALCQSIT